MGYRRISLTDCFRRFAAGWGPRGDRSADGRPYHLVPSGFDGDLAGHSFFAAIRSASSARPMPAHSTRRESKGCAHDRRVSALGTGRGL
jgi:hypothetical protein